MATSQETPFDAGSDFGSPADALAALVSSPPAAPESEPAESPSPDEDSSVESTWQDKSDEQTPAPKTQSPAAPALEVKGAKGVKKFDLDPNNAELKKTLELGLGFRPMQAQRDQARAEAKALSAKIAPLEEKAGVWDELQSLAQAGHTDRVVRAVLGDQAYAAFRKQMVEEDTGYASASPAERRAIEAERARRDSEFQRTQDSKKLSKTEERLAAQEDRIESDRLRGIGQQALAKFSFRDVVQDADQAEAMDQELWSSAWSKLEALADEGQDINAQLVSRVFAQKAKVLRGGIAAAAQTRTTQVIEGKKSVAKAQAQVAATAKYPGAAPAPKVEGWDGRSMSDLVRALRR